MLKTRGVFFKKKKKERKLNSIMHSNVLNHGQTYKNIHSPF